MLFIVLSQTRMLSLQTEYMRVVFFSLGSTTCKLNHNVDGNTLTFSIHAAGSAETLFTCTLNSEPIQPC